MADHGSRPVHHEHGAPGEHSTLEPVDYSGLEPVPEHTPPIPVESPATKESPYAQHALGWGDGYQYQNANPPVEKPTQPRKILGLSVKTFWTFAIILIVLLIGGVAAGIGGGLASRGGTEDSDSSAGEDQAGETTQPGGSATAIAVTTTVAVVVPPTFSSPAATGAPLPVNIGCPDKNGTIDEARDSDGNPIQLPDAVRPMAFVRLCYTNYPGGWDNGAIEDLRRMSPSTMEDCIAACAAFNVDNFGQGSMCMHAVLDWSTENKGCFLKSGYGRNVTKEHPSHYEAASLVDTGLE
ncbi:hypothetical protein VTK26DRAFT_6013 [Humicola hyalothermophila]